jgi:hypothetical protein
MNYCTSQETVFLAYKHGTVTDRKIKLNKQDKGHKDDVKDK